ncbi:hypothetical protein [Persephonella sp.]|uniref:hypothetical protein n=1 Tax=Persephonella sp. TaxID=2060922 RepID=UPI002628A638|nr:hypothetical protein [Persephonella sp.]
MGEYISYWIPTKAPIDPRAFRKGKIEFFSISEPQKKEQYKIDIELTTDDNSYPKFIKIEFSGKNKIAANLKIKDFTKEGVLICEIVYIDPKIKGALNRAIYHGIKEFYHEHEYHSEDEDSLVIGYISSQIPSYKEIIEHYLLIYRNKLYEQYERIQIFLKDILSKQSFIHLLRVFDKAKKLEETYTQAFGELQYAEYLITLARKENINSPLLSEIEKILIRADYEIFTIQNSRILTLKGIVYSSIIALIISTLYFLLPLVL